MSVRFDETAGKRLARTTDLVKFNGAYSVVMWVYPISLPPTDGWSSFITLGSESGPVDLFQMRQAGGRWEIFVEYGGNSSPTGSVVALNQWHYIWLVRESATSLKMYLNGVLDITNTWN